MPGQRFAWFEYCISSPYPFGKVKFTLTQETLKRISDFQQNHPDVTIAECSDYVNRGILNMIEEYESKCPKQ